MFFDVIITRNFAALLEAQKQQNLYYKKSKSLFSRKSKKYLVLIYTNFYLLCVHVCT